MFPGLTEENLAALHALAMSRTDFEGPWGMLRLMCGIHQAILPEGTHPEKTKPLSIDRVAKIHDCTEEEIDVSISFLREAWKSLLDDSSSPEVVKVEPKIAKPERKAPGTQSKIDFSVEQLQLLELGTFTTAIFKFHEDPHDIYMEVEWFCDRLKEVRKVFEEPMAKALARMALLNELQLRRLNDRIVSLQPDDPQFVKLQNVRRDLETAYQDQWKQVEEICPAALASQSRKFSLNVMSDLIRAYQQYKSNPDNRARDGIFTDDEIQILFRSSLQEPNIKYRLGAVCAMNLAKLGISDPKWSRKMSKEDCKVLDAAFAYAGRKLKERLGAQMPDLESSGPDGEYPPIHTKRDGEITDETFEEATDTAGEEAIPTELLLGGENNDPNQPTADQEGKAQVS